MEHYLILIAEFGAAIAVIYGGMSYFFKNSFQSVITPLRESLDLLSYNVNQQTQELKNQTSKLDAIEERVDGHETRLTVIEHDHQKEHK